MKNRHTRPRTAAARGPFRTVERWFVGLVMGMLAFVVERAVLRSIRKGRTTPKPQEPTSITGSGAEITTD